MPATFFAGPMGTGAGWTAICEDVNGNTFDPRNLTGPMVPGFANSVTSNGRLKTAIADSTATTIATITCPNANMSAIIMLFIRAGMTNASHTYDSTRCYQQAFAVTRVAGAVGVIATTSPAFAQIATVAAGQTFTSTLAATAFSGATTVNTSNIQITNVGTPAATTEAQIWWWVLNSQGTLTSPGVTVA